jgi:Kef-type K+ transport system membrane component KefB|uniref:Sodium:proton exchanger n=1 Tax=Desulfobacca acetoxidans TaxID=60893 RepID=A0A7C3WQ19_9BACT
MGHFLEEIGLSIIAATILGLLTYRFRQPVILGYFLAGALIGPAVGLKLVTDPVSIQVISEIGLILLLFVIGLEINFQKIIATGRQLLVAGVGQFLLCVLIGAGFFFLLGFGATVNTLYLALFCAISSTAIVVKLLYDKFELDTLPGRMSLGILIFQDIWAILVIAFQPNFSNPQLARLGLALAEILVLLGLGYLLSRYVLGYIYTLIAKTPELVVAVSIGWCATMVAVADVLGLSKEMGGLIAGVAISNFPYSIHVTAKVLPLRDFFLTLFFISLGMEVPLPTLPMLTLAVVIVAFVIVSRFLTIYPLLSLSGSGRRTSFITSLNLSQISEFSLVIASLGLAYGHISAELRSLLIYAMAFAAILSSYLIKYNHELYLIFQRIVEQFSRSGKAGTPREEPPAKDSHPIVLLGCHRGAEAFIDCVGQSHRDLLKKILVIDFNPEILDKLKARKVHALFGDISSVDTLAHAHIQQAKVIISSIPDMMLKGTNNLWLVQTCRQLAPQAVIVATAESEPQKEELKKAGAHHVILPYYLLGHALLEVVLELDLGAGD